MEGELPAVRGNALAPSLSHSHATEVGERRWTTVDAVSNVLGYRAEKGDEAQRARNRLDAMEIREVKEANASVSMIFFPVGPLSPYPREQYNSHNCNINPLAGLLPDPRFSQRPPGTFLNIVSVHLADLRASER